MPYTQVIAAFISPTRELAKMARQELDKMGMSSLFDIYEEISEDLLPDILNGDKNYQLILATGAAAMFYRQDGRVTVLELLPDLRSFIDDIKDLTKRGIKNIAILGTTNYISTVFDFAIDGAKLKFYPVEFVHNLPNAIESALKPGVEGILGGSFTCKYVQEHHPHIAYKRFSYSLRSLTNILNATQRIVHLEKVKRLQLTRLELIISNIQQGIVIFNNKKETVFHNAQADQILKNHEIEAWYDFMEPFFESTYNMQSVVNIDDKQVLMHTLRFVFPDTDIDNYVVIMQEGSSIEKNEHTLRRHKIAKGLIARATFSSILYRDPLMQDVINKAKLFASTESTVMIYGETGVGKEVMAQSIHNHSARKSEPFVSLNCASLPPSLIESELFGYAEGAFTGARKQGKKGLFELANGGTIFLDEIGELPLEVQSRLLRVIQEREVRRVGDDKIIPLDVRIVCATNRDLLQMCHQGTFRLDLYYRVNVLKLVIPPLKARPLDILALFDKFINDILGKTKAKKFSMDEDAKAYLMSYNWPGNIRELRNVAEAIVLYGPHITLKTLSDVINPYHDSTYLQYAQMRSQVSNTFDSSKPAPLSHGSSNPNYQATPNHYFAHNGYAGSNAGTSYAGGNTAGTSYAGGSTAGNNYGSDNNMGRNPSNSFAGASGPYINSPHQPSANGISSHENHHLNSASPSFMPDGHSPMYNGVHREERHQENQTGNPELTYAPATMDKATAIANTSTNHSTNSVSENSTDKVTSDTVTNIENNRAEGVVNNELMSHARSETFSNSKRNDVFLNVPPSSFPATPSKVEPHEVISNLNNSDNFAAKPIEKLKNIDLIGIGINGNLLNFDKDQASKHTLNNYNLDDNAGVVSEQISGAIQNMHSITADPKPSSASPNVRSPYYSSINYGFNPAESGNNNTHKMDAAINTGIYQPWTTPYSDASKLSDSHVPEFEVLNNKVWPVSFNGVVPNHNAEGSRIANTNNAPYGMNPMGGNNSEVNRSNIPNHEANQAQVTPSLINDNESVLRLNLKLDKNFSLKDIERITIQALLESHSQNEVCDLLGISRVTLWRKLKNE